MNAGIATPPSEGVGPIFRTSCDRNGQVCGRKMCQTPCRGWLLLLTTICFVLVHGPLIRFGDPRRLQAQDVPPVVPQLSPTNDETETSPIAADEEAAVGEAGPEATVAEGAAAASVAASQVASAGERPMIIVVTGAGGTDEYRQEFAAWGDRWREISLRSQAEFLEIGREDRAAAANGTEPTDRQRLEAAISACLTSPASSLWLVLNGHGTFDGQDAKFNLQGPDVSSQELASWLQPLKKTLVVVNCSSSSAPFINHLSGPGRVIITATNSGYEQNYSRFGRYFAHALDDAEADLDHDQQVSLLETFLLAANQTARFYEAEARLATEHGLLDDNGDKLGTGSAFFRGTRVVERPKTGEPDGRMAHRLILAPGPQGVILSAAQQQRRDLIENALEALRLEKDKLDEDQYYQHLEVLAVQLARLYREAAERPLATPPN